MTEGGTEGEIWGTKEKYILSQRDRRKKEGHKQLRRNRDKESKVIYRYNLGKGILLSLF